MSTTRSATSHAATNTPTDTEALRADLELTRQHLADTVQQLTRQLNVPRRMKESASSAGHRAVQTAKHTVGEVGGRAKQAVGTVSGKATQTIGGMNSKARHTAGSTGQRTWHLPEQAKNLPAKVRQVPELSRRHPRATAAVGGAVALGVGAAAWMAGRNR